MVNEIWMVVNTQFSIYDRPMQEFEGIVQKGINNIYTILHENRAYQCRIKGKVLQQEEKTYNPLAPGDVVLFTANQTGDGMITERIKRRNTFERWNTKKSLPQALASNLDLVVCIASVSSPPFRPRFIDRVCVCAGSIPLLIVVNKADLGITDPVLERLQDYERIGYPTLCISANSDISLRSLEDHLDGKQCVFVGQSGAGKSTLINRLIPQAEQKTGSVSEKYNRGRHTTNFSVLLQSEKTSIIDTPGVREIQIPTLEPIELGSYFPEISKLSHGCSYQPCLHKDEPDCKVKLAVEEGKIHEDRYESYLRILETLETRDEY